MKQDKGKDSSIPNSIELRQSKKSGRHILLEVITKLNISLEAEIEVFLQ